MLYRNFLSGTSDCQTVNTIRAVRSSNQLLSLERESYSKPFVLVSVCDLLSGNRASTLFEQRTPQNVDSYCYYKSKTCPK